jgi:hypothetical protein
VGGDLFLRRFTAFGRHQLGAIRLRGAHVGGLVSLVKARIGNRVGSAMNIDYATIEDDLLLRVGVVVCGSGEWGAVRLRGAHIGGDLSTRGAQIVNPSGPAFVADRADVDGALYLVEADIRGDPAVRLNAVTTSTLWLDPSQYSEHNPISLDGATYRGRPRWDPRAAAENTLLSLWLRLLRHATPAYAAQPYQQLAASYAAEGHLGDQRTVLVAQQDDRVERVLGAAVKSGDFGFWTKLGLRIRRFGLRINRAVVGYGYRPWKAAFWLLGIMLAAGILTLAAAHTHDGRTGRYAAIRPPPRPTDPIRSCSEAEQIGLALRIAVPLIGNVTEGNCQINTSHPTGGAYAAGGFGLQTLSWATATLVVAGYTGLIRKT